MVVCVPLNDKKVAQHSQTSVESGYEVVRSLRFKVLKTIQTVYRNELGSNPNGEPYNLNILTPYNLTS
jgi:hypothetical protein